MSSKHISLFKSRPIFTLFESNKYLDPSPAPLRMIKIPLLLGNAETTSRSDSESEFRRCWFCLGSGMLLNWRRLSVEVRSFGGRALSATKSPSGSTRG
jgi:hypothetical protein